MTLELRSIRGLALGAILALCAAPLAAEPRASRRLVDGWEHYRGSLGGPWEVWRGEQVDLIVKWQKIALPHSFNARDAVDPDSVYYQGPGWYRTRLKVDNPFPGGRTLLHFEGAGQKTKVYVFLDEVGDHVGGYDEFTVDITEAAARARQDPALKGEVPIAVRCDNSRDPEMIPSNLSDFVLYGGLYRYVNLVYLPAVSLERIHVASTLTPTGPARVSLKARLLNPAGLADPLDVRVRITDPRGRIVHESGGKRAPWTGEAVLAELSVPRPALWSPQAPQLYRAEVTLAGAPGTVTETERFGLRTFEFVEHGPFKLNGQRLLLRGTHRHEDHAGLGPAMSEELIRRELQLIKDLGANFIRLGHYQQSRLVLDLCDELGLLVWEEIPWCRGGLGGERYRQQARDMLRNMIDQHYNHPAVILWGLGNENDWPGDFPKFDQEAIRGFMSELNELAHGLDPSRRTSIRRCDFCRDIVDVYSPSIWAGWYRGRYTEYKASSETERDRVKRFFHMEWGGDSHAGRHSEDPDAVIAKLKTGQGTDERGLDFLLSGGQERASRDGDWSETYACNLFDWHLKEQETMPWLSGSAQWVFKDFATPLRPENPVPRVNQKGLVERDLTPKEAYYVFQSYWTEKLMARIYGHSWPVRWGGPGEARMVKVYSNGETAELFLNGVSQGVRRRESQDFPAAGLRWMVAFREGQNELRAVARRGGAQVADALTLRYQTRKWGPPARLELREAGRAGDRVTVEAELLDADAVPCLDSRAEVRFAVVGEGELIDNLGTPGGSRLVQLANGRARISLRRVGPLVASVSSPGLGAAFLRLE